MMLHNQYLKRCIQLARLGMDNTGKNPLVGAVLVFNNNIIGEGYHERFGEAHAEVNCLKSVSKANQQFIKLSTLYVNLEPCNHTGKTPPCSYAIVKAGLQKVIVGTEDINPLVAGKGIDFLRKNGIEVIVGICRNECLKLNRIFFTYQKEKRAYIKLKWAQTANGFISKKGEQTIITNDLVNTINHKYRSRIDGVLVGFKTAQIDNPQLNSRHWNGPQPKRIILDWNCELGPKIVSHSNVQTIVLNSKKENAYSNTSYYQVERNALAIAQRLYELDICSVLIEGGAQTHKLFINENIWDEAVVISSNTIINGDCVLAATLNNGTHISQDQIDDNQINQFSNSEFLL